MDRDDLLHIFSIIVFIVVLCVGIKLYSNFAIGILGNSIERKIQELENISSTESAFSQGEVYEKDVEEIVTPVSGNEIEDNRAINPIATGIILILIGLLIVAVCCFGDKVMEKLQKSKQPVYTQEKVEHAPKHSLLQKDATHHIKRISGLAEHISNYTITDTAKRIEAITVSILDRLQESPEQFKHVNKLTTYYLPSVIKLLESYLDLSRVENPDANIIKATSEIPEALKAIHKAFLEMHNDMHMDMALDTITDIEVIKNVISMDGLSEKAP